MSVVVGLPRWGGNDERDGSHSHASSSASDTDDRFVPVPGEIVCACGVMVNVR